MILVKPAAVCIDSSTIDPAVAKSVSNDAHSRGFTFVDAPVSGGVGGAEAGTLTFMCGGPEVSYEVKNLPQATFPAYLVDKHSHGIETQYSYRLLYPCRGLVCSANSQEYGSEHRSLR